MCVVAPKVSSFGTMAESGSPRYVRVESSDLQTVQHFTLSESDRKGSDTRKAADLGSDGVLCPRERRVQQEKLTLTKNRDRNQHGTLRGDERDRVHDLLSEPE